MRARRTWGWVAVAATAIGIVAGTAFAKGSSSTLKGTIEGDVENERQKPVQGAEVVVEVEGKPPLKATTDASGHFTLAGVPVGDVKVKVLAKGYYPWEETIVVAGKGSTHASATLKLGVRLAGKVVDEKGAPVEGVTVRAGVEDSSTWVNGVEIGVKRVTTAADGTFQIDGLGPARRYELTCRHPHFETMHVKDLPGRAGTVKEGIEVVMKSAAWVTGVVVDAAGKPVKKARMGGAPDSPPIEPPTTTEDERARKEGMRWFGGGGGRVDVVDRDLSDDQGRFTVGGLQGPEAEIVADADGYFVAKVKVTGLEPGKETSGVSIPLEATSASMEGGVVDGLGRPLEFARVTLVADDGETAAEGTTDEAGAFRFPRVRSHGPVTVNVWASGYAPATWQGVALNKRGLKLQMSLAPRITLAVRDDSGAPVPKFRVEVTCKGTDGGASGDTTETWSHEYEQKSGSVDVTVPVGEVTLKVTAKGYEEATAGPFTTKTSQVQNGGTVTLKKKDE